MGLARLMWNILAPKIGAFQFGLWKIKWQFSRKHL
jgi:hypothetical protein